MGQNPLVLHMTLDPSGPLAGSIVNDSDPVGLAFTGWLGLFEAIEVLRQRAAASGEPLQQRSLGSTQLPPG